MKSPAAAGLGAALIRENIQRIAEQARSCKVSPTAPNGQGWGVPDWRDASAYPASDELDDLEWRWEFLRRRHGYRLDWLRPETDFHPANRQQYFEEVYELELPSNPRLSIRDLATWMSPVARRGTDAVFRFPVSGLVPFRRALLSNLVVTIGRLDRIIPDSPTVDDIFARFDLGQAIGAQLEQIANYLKALRAEAYGDEDAARKQRQLWPTYLRLLDAKDAGASLREMTVALSRHGEHTPQRARAALQSAEDLRRDWRHGSRLKE